MANFETKNIREIHDDFIARYRALRNKYGDNVTPLEKGAVQSLAWAYAGIAATLWIYGLWIYQQCFPQTCCLFVLKLWGSLIGVEYQTGQKANLQIKLENVTATYLSAQTVYKDLISGLTFKTVSQSPNQNGEITATVECTQSGPIGNLEVGTELTIANPTNGIPEKAKVTSVVILGTNDEETETYRKRVLYRFRNKSQTGSPIDYYNWAMEVSGIADVFPYVLEEGIITLFVVSSDGEGKYRTPTGEVTPNPFPKWKDGQFTELTGEGQFLQIANAITGSEKGIHDRRPVMATVELKPPNYTAFKVEITGLSDTSYSDLIRTSIINELDKKRPHIIALNYGEANAKINASSLSAVVNSVIGEATFQKFTLKKEDNSETTEEVLGIGSLSYLSELIINGEIIYRG